MESCNPAVREVRREDQTHKTRRQQFIQRFILTSVKQGILMKTKRMKVNNDLTKVLKKEHQEKWVALNETHSKVVGFSEKLVDLTERMGNKKVVYMRVPRFDTEYAF